MDVQQIIAELTIERDRINAAITALDSTNHAHKPSGKRTRRKMSPDARKRIGAAMRKRWKERKKEQKQIESK